jgi:hypothetical protein
MLDGHSYILTNAHVVREAVKISVRVPDSGLDNFPAYCAFGLVPSSSSPLLVIHSRVVCCQCSVFATRRTWLCCV